MNTSEVTRLSNVLDKKVFNTNNDQIGHVIDAVAYEMGGKIAYLVLNFKQHDKDKFFAVPWEAFLMDKNKTGKLILDVQEKMLKDAPSFDKNNWPSHPQTAFINKIYTYYELEPVFLENNLSKANAEMNDVGIDTNRESPDMEDSSFKEKSIERQGIGNPRRKHERSTREL